jgi:glycosyltransferase involved in cell wall biosynthesis
MKKGYLPKEERKTILFLADDIRTQSGVGTMAREIVINTAHRFNWINLGAAMKHPDAGKAFDVSHEIGKFAEIEDASVKIIPSNGYGDASVLNRILMTEKPDAILHFTDPRYWTWLYKMENEIRQNIPMIFYTIWDDVPYPFYNREYYRSDDMLLCISKQTKNIVENVLRDHPKPDWAIKYVPHGIDHTKFFPVKDDTEFETFRNKVFDGKEYD